MTVARVGYVAAILLLLACLVVVLLLVLIRIGTDRSERARQTLRTPVWGHILMLSAGEPDEVEAAQERLLALGPADRAAVVDDAFALVPKLRGDARDRLRDVLRAWGSVDEAVRGTTSRSPVRRCRGIYRLGVLADTDRCEDVLAGLDDSDFAVRRSAVLALGAFPNEVVVEHLLRRAALEPRLRPDFLASLGRIGAVALPVLREGLARALTEHEDGDRHGPLAAEALGLVGAIQAVPALEAALKGSSVELKLACIDALGELGASSSVDALSGVLGHTNPDVRRAAARALGLVGGPRAVPTLTRALHDDNVEVARAAANALHRCGDAGREVLEATTAPVAREVLSLAALGIA